MAEDSGTPAAPAGTPAPQAPEGPQNLVETVATPAVAPAATVVAPAATPDPTAPGFLGGKYKTPEELEGGYKELQRQFTEATTKLKGFVGAPEKYELSMPDDLKGAVDWNSEDPLMTEFQTFAKESGMSQDTFTKALHMLAKYEYTMETVDLQAEKALLGDRADERLTGFTDWARANLSEESYQEVLSTLGHRSSPAKVFKAMEALLDATRQQRLPPPGDDVQSGMTMADVDAMYAKKNDKGQRLVEVDPEYLKKCRAARSSVVGTGSADRVVNFSR